jgi:molybdate transport system substrate-binding protein
MRSPRWAISTAAAALATSTLIAAGCSGGAPSSQLTVYAASSLTEAFGDMETLFERAHPGIDVAITFAGSQVLRIQIEEGAPADAFASANPEHMQALVDAGLVRSARVFAHNELVLIVPSDDPAGIETFDDLPDAERLVLGTAEVPVGRYARRVLAAADSLVRPGFEAAVMRHLVSEESNVRLARSKVELGEADAAIVYRTDAALSDAVRTIPIPKTLNVRADYLIGVVAGGASSDLADAWIATVLSPEGQAVLERYGFLPA